MRLIYIYIYIYIFIYLFNLQPKFLNFRLLGQCKPITILKKKFVKTSFSKKKKKKKKKTKERKKGKKIVVCMNVSYVTSNFTVNVLKLP